MKKYSIWLLPAVMLACLFRFGSTASAGARISLLYGASALTALLKALAMDDDTLRTLYKRVRLGGTLAPAQLASDTGLSFAQVLTGLVAFHQVHLAELSLDPYAVRLLPPQKCSMADSDIVRYLRAIH